LPRNLDDRPVRFANSARDCGKVVFETKRVGIFDTAIESLRFDA
jgi:hypothetical protein